MALSRAGASNNNLILHPILISCKTQAMLFFASGDQTQKENPAEAGSPSSTI
jgi:hypothetical protein